MGSLVEAICLNSAKPALICLVCGFGLLYTLVWFVE